MSHQRRGYAASAAAMANEINHVGGWPTASGERPRESKYPSNTTRTYSSRYYENLSDLECSPEPAGAANRRMDSRDRRPAPFHYQFDGEDSDSGNDSTDEVNNVPSPMRSAYSEPVMLAHPRPNANSRPLPPQPQQRHRSSRSSQQPRQPSTHSLDSTEREALLDRVRQLSSNEAETAAALARATHQNAALMEEVTHWRAVAKEAAASRRAAREALSDVSSENARLAAAYSAQRLEAEALHEALFHERSQAGARVAELEHALHVAEAKVDSLTRKDTRDQDTTPPTAPASTASASATPTRPTTATSDKWDQERQDLLSLLERLQEQLATHAAQQQEAASQQTPLKRPLSGRQAAREQPESTPPPRSSSRSTPVVYSAGEAERKTPSSINNTAPGAPRSANQKMPPRGGGGGNTPSKENLHEENSKTPTPVEPLGVRCESYFESTATETAEATAPFLSQNVQQQHATPPMAQTPPLSATRPSSGDFRAATTPIPSIDTEKAVEKQKHEITAAELKNSADKLFRQKRYDDALKQYNAALAAAETAAASEEDIDNDALPMVIGLLCSRATALSAVGRYLESAADCCRAEKLTLPFGGSCPRAIDLRAEAFSLMGAFDLASDDLDKLWQFSTASTSSQNLMNSNNNTSTGGAPAIVARLQDARRAAADSSPRNHYAILGVKPSATAIEIKSAYKSLALRLHPDKAADALGHDTATLLFSLLSAAHATLLNTQSRRAYDLQLLRQKYLNGSSSTVNSTSSSGMGSSYRR